MKASYSFNLNELIIKNSYQDFHDLKCSDRAKASLFDLFEWSLWWFKANFIFLVL